MGLFSFLESKKEKINGVEFPKLINAKRISSYQRNTSKYKRKGYYYKNIDDIQLQEYINQISSYGFNQKTNVRYENSNGDYIIIEKTQTYGFVSKQDVIHIAFHVKKLNY